MESAPQMFSEEKKNKDPNEVTDLRDIGKILIFGDIKEETTKTIVESIYITMEKMCKEGYTGDKVITLIISSNGGDGFSGFDIIGAIKEAQNRGILVRGIVNSHAESTAFFIFEACDKRIMTRGAFLMVHGPTYGFFGDSRDMDAEKKLNSYLEDNLLGLVYKRTPEIDLRQWKTILRDCRKVYYTAQEAVTAGLADRIG